MNLEALRKSRVPRYTSYPAAPHFGPVTEDDVKAALGRIAPQVSFYVHIPFCRELCFYCGCNRVTSHRTSAADSYLDDVAAELDLLTAHMPAGRTVRQLHLGGGTPTFLTNAQITRLVQMLDDRLPPAANPERSIEIDPRSVDDNELDTLVSLGFNRFSIGVQDFNQKVMESVNRAQPKELTERVVSRLRALGQKRINFDLMFGLPNQTLSTWKTTVQAAIEMSPSRFAMFPYAHVPWMKPAQKILELEPGGLPGLEQRVEMFEAAEEWLDTAGYVRVGMDHFARPDDQLVLAQENGTLHRNFQGYTTHAGLDLIGLGVSSIGAFGGLYAQNDHDLKQWREKVRAGQFPLKRGHRLTDDDQRRASLISDILCMGKVQWRDHFQPSPEEMAELQSLQKMGIVDVDEEGLQLSHVGRDYSRNVAVVFDAYARVDDGQTRYSRSA